ncbi:MAG: ABC-F family ATP-binding cassette domain-containing protein [Bacteroidota bacterium]
MISINNLSFHFGSRTLYEEASLHIKPKDRIGLIGANGTGKSTLLRLITGEYTPDAGTIEMSKDCSIGFLNQDLLSYQSDDSILHVAMQAFERALEVDTLMHEVLNKMELEYTDELMETLGKLQNEYESLDGYTLQSRAEAILEGLGFDTEALQRPLRTFSGGWRMRVMLAKLLLQKPSLLMLDEPTNHLDMPSIQWIEEYLETYEGAIIVVSHDRQFLDNTVETIVEVAQQKMHLYAGNFSFFIEEKALRQEIQKGSFENQQAQIRQTERFIERFKAKASKSKQVQSRVKSLQRLDMIEDVVDETARVNFKFTFSVTPGRNVIEMEDVSKSYGKLNVISHSNAIIERGDKIALIGANGKGKSTLLRIIGGEEVVEGKRQEGYNVIKAFFAQHQLESLNVENSMLEELKQAGSTKTEMELRGILGCFLFSGDDVFKKIKVLSGGEKSRVALAKTLISQANFLLLDEPTNHLDMVSVNILIQALQQYEGTFVVVSHDRFFVSEVANKIWYIEDREIKQYPGTFEEYEFWQSQRVKEPTGKSAAAKKEKEEKPRPVTDQEKADNQKALKKVNTRIAELEANISKLEARKAELEGELAKPSVYSNPDKLHQANTEFSRVGNLLKLDLQAWEEAGEEQDRLKKVV